MVFISPRRESTAKVLMPRRYRRGMGLLDSILGLILFVAMATMAIQIATNQLKKHARDVEARNLWEVKSALKSYVDTDVAARHAAAVTSGGALQVTPTTLRAANITLRDSALHGLERRDIDMWMVAEGADLVYFARATGAIKSPHYPAANVSYGPMGSVSGEEPTRVQGPSLDWDVSGLQIRHGLPIMDDVLAVEFVSMTADLYPYLSRTGATTAGGVNLSRMEADLDMGGNDITSVNNVTASGTLTADTVNADAVTINGPLSATNMAVAETLTVSSGVTAGDITSLNALATGSAVVSGALSAGSVTVSGQATYGELSVTGNIDVGGDLAANTATFETLETTTVLSTGGTGIELDAWTATFDQLVTGGCSGC